MRTANLLKRIGTFAANSYFALVIAKGQS